MGILNKVVSSIRQRSYDLDSVQGIRSIPVPTHKQRLTRDLDIRQNIEYILQRKATEHKQNGRLDLAIECLFKANAIMPYSAFGYPKKDYMRLVEYLKIDRRFDAARIQEEQINQYFRTYDDAYKLFAVQQARQLGTDLLEMSEHNCTCGECAKYQGRVFSISGQSRKFPKLPDSFWKYGKIHEGCRHEFHPFFDGVSTPTYHRNIVQYSNRPFVDNRTKAEKAEYEKRVSDEATLQKDKADYDWLYEHLPEIAPKSLAGYRRMKNTRSANYLKIVKAAKELGREIE